ncbi:SPOR domain-containing protein [Undibacterium sp. RTI2.1]|uniref:SPOR domain-containing protein n=1 Tax=unclassified Undibacterium TaxID=2630295 RepID=UPI002AB3A13C|nr:MULTISPECIES: SPOR domain-containing protein [unclassified Undibacterium]MDY7538205.1 SPOR domain-containing protein [Undibacterium sp. 5I1]MEB0032493.1 SPOR domain-containing protein [Undibacterium sp. RTI2.1]MEB0116805.1 SPOR domain-containing protein [Undibacterium sp. RTI2.2]MEB0229608.1 SPOR domain-containing protein [Undibacterium sp. 10I3]MEB0257313.1 SPOR domain-containing protein [Undibacterium sp. 5I1]
MSLLSRFKQKQETTSDQDNGEYRSRAEDDTKPVRGSKRADRSDNARKSKVADPILPEKKRARRRLIGAIALVLAAVIGLPMILDSEPKPLADDIAIQIPSKDKLPASEQVAVPKVAGKPAEKPDEPLEEIIDPPQTQQKPQVKASSKDVAALPAVTLADSKVSAKPEVKPESKSDPKVFTDAKPASRPELKPETKSARAEIKIDTKSDTKADTKPETKVEAKIPVIKPPVKSSEQNDDAARALAILEGKTVKPAVKAEVQTKEHSGYVVQAGAFSTPEKISEVQDKLKAAGIKSYTQKVATSPNGDKSVTRIRVGPFESKEEADKATANLVKLGLSPKLIPN